MVSRFILPALIFTGLLVSSCDLNNAKNPLEAAFPCEDGLAMGTYSCENVDLFSELSIYELSGDSVGVYLNDIWG
ncbi:MAG TPA: hypothetical protein DEG32_05075, partial [Balneolaceae bacterium]|nr:hypothetical protein [Balneolaceae bacterium]